MIDVGSAFETLAKVLPATVALIGLIVAVSQFSLGARLRRRQTWLREEITFETDSHRIFHLESMLRSASASLVANLLVPSKYLIETAVWLVLSPTLVSLVLSQAPNPINVIVTLFSAWTSLAIPLRRGMRVYSERRRIAFAYRNGGRPIAAPRLDLLAQMEGGARIEFLQSFTLALFMICLSGGISLLIQGVPFESSILVAGIGGGGAWVVLAWIGSYLQKQARSSYLSSGN
jgi:hypothetical protein